VEARVWVAASSLSKDDALYRIQTLSHSSVICTLSGSSLTAKVLSKHDGGVLNVIGEKSRVECPLIKWGCDASWSSTMQLCNEMFLGLVSWNVLKDVYSQMPQWQPLFEVALEHYFRSLADNCTATHFAGRGTDDAAAWISGMLAKKNVLQREIDDALPLLALFHFSQKDIYRCLVYRDKLRGLSTAGGTLVHLGLHLPDLPWTGTSEAQKTTLKYRELSGVSRESAPFATQQAEARILTLRSLLMRLPLVDEDASLLNAGHWRVDQERSHRDAQGGKKAAPGLATTFDCDCWICAGAAFV
jgi:hypothetical protein